MLQAYLMYVTNITNGICGDKFVVWSFRFVYMTNKDKSKRNFRFLHMTDVEKCIHICHVKTFQISPHGKCVKF